MQGYCVPGCAEDIIGMTFYRYILTNVVSINGVELVSALGKKCLHMASHVEPPWVCLQCPLVLLLATNPCVRKFPDA